jgi:hypothetical protein
MLLNKKKYEPVDDDSPTGYKRPTKDPASVCDYFHALAFLEDGGKFATKEMKKMLSDPEKFFRE